jgi:hypothetical protein
LETNLSDKPTAAIIRIKEEAYVEIEVHGFGVKSRICGVCSIVCSRVSLLIIAMNREIIK